MVTVIPAQTTHEQYVVQGFLPKLSLPLLRLAILGTWQGGGALAIGEPPRRRSIDM